MEKKKKMTNLTNVLAFTNTDPEENQEQEDIEADPLDLSSKIDFDEKEIIRLIEDEKMKIDQSRSVWMNRKLEFLNQWDNFVDYRHDRIIPQQKYMHYPLAYEKIIQWHSRMLDAVFSYDPIFTMTPLSHATKSEAEATKNVLAWYLRDEINEGQGLYPVFDELFWDLGTDGWGCIYKRWEKKMRKSREVINPSKLRAEVMDAASQIRKRGRPRKMDQYQEIPKIIKVFDGIYLDTLPHESVYFPEEIATSSDLNKPWLVFLEIFKSEEDLIRLKEMGYYDAKATDDIIGKGKGFTDPTKKTLILERERLAGIQKQEKDFNEIYPLNVAFMRKDLDGDGIPEEYVLSLSLKAKRVAKITYLDKFCFDYRRPIYKFDLMKRPRSSYSRGFVEVLYPFNQDMDDYRNTRRASGLIANVPWGFYRPGSGLEKEIIEVSPGKFYPADEPTKDVHAMQFGNTTSWFMQEEQMTSNYADRIVSMPGFMSGQMSGPIGPLRSTSGVNTLGNEASMPMKVYLKRIHQPLNLLLNGILSDLQNRLPDSIKIKVLGEDSGALYGEKGEMLTMPINKKDIQIRCKFSLAANDANQNPEKERQMAMATVQIMLNQMAVQMGIVQPRNVYNAFKNLLRKSGNVDIDDLITAPKDAFVPMNLWEEYSAITSGRVPMVLMNDDHQAKIEGLMILAQSQEYEEGKQLKTISPLADTIMNQVIQTHQRYLQMIQSMPAMNNQSGMQIPATVGAESAGVGPQQTVGDQMGAPEPAEGEIQ